MARMRLPGGRTLAVVQADDQAADYRRPASDPAAPPGPPAPSYSPDQTGPPAPSYSPGPPGPPGPSYSPGPPDLTGPSAPVGAPPVRPGSPAAGPAPRSPGPAATDPATDPSAPLFVAGTAITILAVLLLVFAAELLVIGHLRYARDQRTAFDDLRVAFANGTAAVDQLGDDGKPVPLGTPLGVIEIPQLGVRQVFFEGTTSQVMMSGPGHERDSALPGQAGISVIMGRKAGFGGPFNYLAQLSPNSILWVWTGQGKAGYRVTGIRRSGDAAPAAPAAGQGQLTLITADGGDYSPDGILRVDAVLVQTRAESAETAVAGPQPSGPRPITSLVLPLDERPMSAENGAWSAIALCALGLCAGALALTWARLRWGRWQTWLAAGPALVALALATSEQLARLLPNLL